MGWEWLFFRVIPWGKKNIYLYLASCLEELIFLIRRFLVFERVCCCSSKTASQFEGQSSLPVFWTTVSISSSSIYRNTNDRED